MPTVRRSLVTPAAIPVTPAVHGLIIRPGPCTHPYPICQVIVFGYTKMTGLLYELDNERLSIYKKILDALQDFLFLII